MVSRCLLPGVVPEHRPMDSLNECEVSFASVQCSYACRKMSIPQSACRMRAGRMQIARKMSYVNVRVHESLMQQIQARQLEWQTTTGVVNDLLASALDSTLTLGKPQPASGHPQRDKVLPLNKKDEERVRALSLEAMPVPPVKGKPIDPALELHCALIRDFWRTKKGSKGERAWKLLQTGLKAIQTAYGDSVVKEQLELAINGRWASVTLANYERFRPTKQSFDAPQANHPAHKVFKADDLGPEWDIPSATGGRGVLEPGAF